jgi:hypothetical protein
LVLIGGMLGYAYLGLQPRIDALFAEVTQPGSGELAGQIGSLRLRRKRMASVCMFVVLIESMLGVQVWAPFPVWLTALLAVALALFTWRAYSSVTPFGWV